MSALFIDDGYTLDGTVQARPGVHPALRFKYRPALPERVQKYLGVLNRGDDAAIFKAKVALVQEHLVEWDAPQRPEEGNLKRLRFQVLGAVIDVITGYATGGEAEDDVKN